MEETAASRAKPQIWKSEPQVIYRLRGWLRALQWFAIIAGLLGSLTAVSVGLWRWTLSYTHYGPAVVWRWSLPWLLASVGLSPAFILGGLSYWRTRRTAAALYPSGLVFHQRGHRTQVPWQEIQQLTLTGPWSDLPVLRSQGHPAVLLLHTESDGRIRLTHDLENFEDLVGRIKENVYPRMQQAYSQVFNRGQTLHFGPLSMDQRSLRVGRREYPWEQIMAAELHRGLLRIRLAGTEDGTLEIEASRVPNVDLCIQMIGSLTESR